MLLTLPAGEMRSMLHRQIGSFFPLLEAEVEAMDSSFDEALERCEKCFSKVRNKYYHEGGRVKFDALHGCQWTAFLYFLSNTIFQRGGC